MAFDTLEPPIEVPSVGAPADVGRERSAVRAPAWARDLRPALPAGVSVVEGELVDEVPAVSLPLEPQHREVLAALREGASVGALDERFPGSWRLLERLNANHMLNFEAPGRLDLSLRASGRPYRCALGGARRSVVGVAGAVRAIARCVWRTARHPVNAALIVSVGALALATGGSAVQELALIAGLAVAGYVLHEWGHAAAAALLGAPAYALSQPLSVSVWARLDLDRQARLFAAAGPTVACLFGVAVHLVALRVGADRPWLCSAPLLVHALALTPLCQDGRTLLFGLRPRRQPGGAQ